MGRAVHVPLKGIGLVEPEEERHQWVFHVMVSDRYSEWREIAECWPASSRESRRRAQHLPAKNFSATDQLVKFLTSYSMIILMAGLPGTGKTTARGHLASRTGGAVLNKDEIRAALFPRMTSSTPPSRTTSVMADDAGGSGVI